MVSNSPLLFRSFSVSSPLKCLETSVASTKRVISYFILVGLRVLSRMVMPLFLSRANRFLRCIFYSTDSLLAWIASSLSILISYILLVPICPRSWPSAATRANPIYYLVKSVLKLRSSFSIWYSMCISENPCEKLWYDTQRYPAWISRTSLLSISLPPTSASPYLLKI